MPQYYDWRIEASPVGESVADELDEALAYWSEWRDFEGGIYFTSFSTDSLCADEEIDSAMRGLSKKHPEIKITVYQKQDVEECPDKQVYQNGEVRYFTGITKYFEYDPQTGQTSEIADDA